MNRRVKKVDETSNNTTWYVRGPGGKTHAIYKDIGSGAAKAEQFVYGKSRVGTKYTGNDPAYMYEIRNHLGNVKAVIHANAVDDATGADTLLSWSDYYPFGSRMRRSDIPGYGKYRYGYQGENAEEDEETGWNYFESRMYDPVIGRWLSVDPAGQYPSPYLGMGNDPVNLVDPSGEAAAPPDWFVNDKGDLVYLKNKDANDVDPNKYTWIAGDDASYGEIASTFSFLDIANESQLMKPVDITPTFWQNAKDIGKVAGKQASDFAQDQVNTVTYIGTGVLSPIFNAAGGGDVSWAKVYTFEENWKLQARPLDNGTLSNKQLKETIHYTTNAVLMRVPAPNVLKTSKSKINRAGDIIIAETGKNIILKGVDHTMDYHGK